MSYTMDYICSRLGIFDEFIRERAISRTGSCDEWSSFSSKRHPVLSLSNPTCLSQTMVTGHSRICGLSTMILE